MTAGFELSGRVSSPDLLSLVWSNGAAWVREPRCVGEAQLSLEGPDGVWYGVGFGQSIMKNTYAIVVDGAGNVEERLLGDHRWFGGLGRSVGQSVGWLAGWLAGWFVG